MPRARNQLNVKPHFTDLNPSSFPANPHPIKRDVAVRHSARRRHRLGAAVFATTLLFVSVTHAETAIGTPVAGTTARDPFSTFVDEAAQRFGIPPCWIRAVMNVESGGQARELSPKGAMGLMQIMPETWADLRASYGLGADPYDPHDNILAGAAYLRELHDRYGAPGFLAAYNAGPARWEDHLATGRPLPEETQAYVAALAPLIDRDSITSSVITAAVVPSWTVAQLFVMQAGSSGTGSRTTAAQQANVSASDHRTEDWTALAPQSDGLFVPRSRRDPHP